MQRFQRVLFLLLFDHSVGKTLTHPTWQEDPPTRPPLLSEEEKKKRAVCFPGAKRKGKTEKGTRTT